MLALVRGAAITALAYASPAIAQSVVLSPATMPRIARVDQRYQSYNIEMAEVIGGSFWKPYDKQGETTHNERQTRRWPAPPWS
jgi:heparanase